MDLSLVDLRYVSLGKPEFSSEWNWNIYHSYIGSESAEEHGESTKAIRVMRDNRRLWFRFGVGFGKDPYKSKFWGPEVWSTHGRLNSGKGRGKEWLTVNPVSVLTLSGYWSGIIEAWTRRCLVRSPRNGLFDQTTLKDGECFSNPFQSWVKCHNDEVYVFVMDNQTSLMKFQSECMQCL